MGDLVLAEHLIFELADRPEPRNEHAEGGRGSRESVRHDAFIVARGPDVDRTDRQRAERPTRYVARRTMAPAARSTTVAASNLARSIRSTSHLPISTPTGIAGHAHRVEVMSSESNRPAMK